MKRSGRDSKYPQELIDRAVKEYVSSNKSAKEVGAEYGMSSATLLYHYHKWKDQKDMEENSNGEKIDG